MCIRLKCYSYTYVHSSIHIFAIYSKLFQKSLAKQGLKFKLNTKVVSAEKQDGKVYLKTEAAKGGKEETVSS